VYTVHSVYGMNTRVGARAGYASRWDTTKLMRLRLRKTVLQGFEWTGSFEMSKKTTINKEGERCQEVPNQIKSIEIIYLENLYYILAGIHGMGHFGKILAPQPI
jgi:hypothetical protein